MATKCQYKFNHEINLVFNNVCCTVHQLLLKLLCYVINESIKTLECVLLLLQLCAQDTISRLHFLNPVSEIEEFLE